MKFLITIALIATVASAAIVKPTQVTDELAAIQEVIAAINSPSTDPATAAALEQMLYDLLGIGNPEPVVVGPAIVDSFEPIIVGPAIIEPNPIAIGPAIIDFPLPDGGAVTAPVEPSPVVVAPTPVAPESSPLVQIIVNVNKPAAAPVLPSPVVVPELVQPEPVQIVDQAPIAPEPVIIVESPIAVEPVQVVDIPIVVPEPVIIGTPVLPSPAIVLPETLN